MMNPTTDSIDATLFGMPVRTGRWVFVLAGMLMNVCLGTVYAWSVFRAPVAKLFSTADVPITAKQTLWPFMLFLALFTVLMPISGRIVQKVHPRTVSLVGSLIVAAGWILSGYATGMPWLYLTYGVLAGTGVGIVYGIPIAVVTKWFPDIKGLAVGLTVLGFGVSALVMAPLAQALIETKGILNTFFILGIAFLVLLVLMSLILQFPPAGWRPEGWQGAAAAASERNYTAAEMLRTSSCLGLWLCFIIGSLSGLMAIGISSDVGKEIIKLPPATAAGLVSFFALFNGGGRPLFGWLTDAIGHSKAAAPVSVADRAGVGRDGVVRWRRQRHPLRCVFRRLLDGIGILACHRADGRGDLFRPEELRDQLRHRFFRLWNRRDPGLALRRICQGHLRKLPPCLPRQRQPRHSRCHHRLDPDETAQESMSKRG